MLQFLQMVFIKELRSRPELVLLRGKKKKMKISHRRPQCDNGDDDRDDDDDDVDNDDGSDGNGRFSAKCVLV